MYDIHTIEEFGFEKPDPQKLKKSVYRISYGE